MPTFLSSYVSVGQGLTFENSRKGGIIFGTPANILMRRKKNINNLNIVCAINRKFI